MNIARPSINHSIQGNDLRMYRTEYNMGLDLFRLFSMFLVVMVHICGGKGGIFSLYFCLSVCAVNCFGILSGYVGFGSRHRVEGLLGLWWQVLWYYFLINCVGLWLFPDRITAGKLWKSFFPLCTNAYWYFTAWFCLFWTMPALDCIIIHLEKRKAFLLVLILGILLCGTSFAPLRHLGNIFGTGNSQKWSLGYCAPWLGYLYLVGAYIRKYPPETQFAPDGISLGIWW